MGELSGNKIKEQEVALVLDQITSEVNNFKQEKVAKKIAKWSLISLLILGVCLLIILYFLKDVSFTTEENFVIIIIILIVLASFIIIIIYGYMPKEEVYEKMKEYFK